MNYQLELKQLVDYPRCRIYRNFIRTLTGDKSIRTSGNSYLFYFLLLCSYANYRKSNRRFDGVSYALSAWEPLCFQEICYFSDDKFYVWFWNGIFLIWNDNLIGYGRFQQIS